MRIPIRPLLLVPVLVTALCGQAPSPHDGWKLVPGGENLLVNGYWDTFTEGTAQVLVQVNNGVLTATALNDYLGNPNALAPRLETKGDFGVVATMQTAAGMDGLITLTGSMQTGAQSYEGLTEVQFGVDNSGSYVFGYWDGTHSSPAFQVLKGGSGTPAAGTLTMELLRKQGQFYLYFNGVQYGPIADPGFFTLGFAIPGFIVYPNQQLKLTQLAFEVPIGDTSAHLTTPGSVTRLPGSAIGAHFRHPSGARNARDRTLHVVDSRRHWRSARSHLRAQGDWGIQFDCRLGDVPIHDRDRARRLHIR